MLELPLHVTVGFIITTMLTAYLVVKEAFFSRTLLFVISFWLIIHAVVSLTGFYTITDVMPPRFLLLVLPPAFTIIVLMFFKNRKAFLDNYSIKSLLLIHLVRIPVEIILFWLYKESKVPELMTFEGRNPDIFMGLTAAILLVIMRKAKVNRYILLAWNFIGLLLLINIVSLAVLSSPFPFQRLAFDQPNVAVLYFPFIWLPCFIVPVVLFSHLVMIRQLITNKKQDAKIHPVVI